jgi:hypothetical protein
MVSDEHVQEIIGLREGLGAILMSIDARLEKMFELLGGDDAEEDQS